MIHAKNKTKMKIKKGEIENKNIYVKYPKSDLKRNLKLNLGTHAKVSNQSFGLNPSSIKSFDPKNLLLILIYKPNLKYLKMASQLFNIRSLI